MKKNYLKIQPVVIDSLERSITVNAIYWTCSDLSRDAKSAILLCELVFIPDTDSVDVNDLENSNQFYPSLYPFNMILPESVLSVWLDDSVIDDFVLTYSPKFIRA